LKKVDLGQVINVLANVGVLAGIIFLAFELRQNTQATQLASAHNSLSSSFEFDLRIAEDPELASLLIKADKPAALTDIDRLRLERWAYSALRHWENAHYMYSATGLDENFWTASSHEIQNILAPDSFVTNHWQAHKLSFTREFNEELEAMMREISND
jgi:hypothetical protein